MKMPDRPFGTFPYDIFNVITDHEGEFVQHAVARHFTMSLSNAQQWVDYHEYSIKRLKLRKLLESKNGRTKAT
jgi:hypothetical protein